MEFFKLFPGLVGGHCIGVDPYYLASKAQEIGHNPEMILAGEENQRSYPYLYCKNDHQTII